MFFLLAHIFYIYRVCDKRNITTAEATELAKLNRKVLCTVTVTA